MKRISKEFTSFTVLGGEDLSIRGYFNDIYKIAPLSKNEEKELFIKAKSGCKKSLETIIKSNLKFVIMVAKRYTDNNFSLNELKSVGNVGLIKAIKTFDETKNNKFITYATWYIQKEITEFKRGEGKLIKISSNKIPIKHKMDSLKKEFIKVYDKEPKYSDLESFYAFDGKKGIEWDYLISNWHISLESPISGDNCEEDLKYETILPSSDSEENSIKEDNEFLRVKISQLMNLCLTPREKDIITKIFDLNKNGNEMSEEKIAKEYSLSNERVRQLKENALKKMRNYKEEFTLS